MNRLNELCHIEEQAYIIKGRIIAGPPIYHCIRDATRYSANGSKFTNDLNRYFDGMNRYLEWFVDRYYPEIKDWKLTVDDPYNKTGE